MPPDTPTVLQVLAICGSLRSGSYNAGLVRELLVAAPASMSIDVLDGIDRLPLVNNDLVVDGAPPESVLRLDDRIRSADTVIIASPEYCYGIPAPLKNLLDWIASPPHVNCFRFKPVGLIGASIGVHGTLRAQLALRQTLLFLEAAVLAKPEVYIADAAAKYDGELVDQKTKELLRLFLGNLEEFARATLSRRLDPNSREFLFT
ncbi:NADPH-dependent FMN reductase [Pseudonocardia sp. CA-142604]|uniref:NADPH-dependent FMN reductase n=1 Tax=Pseudonocardia sp. CA-142604 TaxID=3240024 RepID=UPI003D8A4729